MCSFRDLRVRLRRAPSAHRMVLRCHAGHGVESCGSWMHHSFFLFHESELRDAIMAAGVGVLTFRDTQVAIVRSKG